MTARDKPGKPKGRGGLSPEGWRRFGEWTANRLTVVAGASFGLVVIPGMVGDKAVADTLMIAGVLGGLLASAAAVVIYFITAERPEHAPEVKRG